MMDPTRRSLVAAALGAAAGSITPAEAGEPRGAPAALGHLGLDATAFGMNPGSPDDQSSALARALAEAARREAPLLVPPGRYRAGNVALPERARLVGVPGASVLVASSNAPILTGRGLKRAALDGLSLEGLKSSDKAQHGLADFDNVGRLSVADCAFSTGRAGLTLRHCGGRIVASQFAAMAETALFSIDAVGLAILDNSVEGCGNNGIQVWRSDKGDDGTILRGNRIARIRFDAGGTGQNGNGISIFRAGGVIVEGNTIRDCALSAIRNNSGSNCQIIGNNCARLGETAIYAEFAFQGSLVANNLVEEAMIGISITNLDQGGRLAVCAGNLVRGLKFGRPPYEGETTGGIGIHVEAETAVSGNVVEDAAEAGISAGWAWAMRNLVICGNMISRSPNGIRVSLVPKERNALIAGNVISGATRGAIVGYELRQAVTGDLARAPDRRADGIRIEGNAVA